MSEKLDSIQQLRISGVKNKEIQNLREYVELLKDGIDEETAFKRTMAGVSSAAQKQAESYTQLFNSYKTGKISLQQYEASMQSLVEVERIATVESKALSVGLNLIGNIAIAAAITGIVKLFQYLTTFEERSAKAAEDLSNKLKEANDSLEEENAYLEDLIKQYTQLYSSNKDITTIKGELSSIQDEIIKKYGEEADAIDVVNGKYSEEIKEIKKLGVEKAKQYLSENQADIRDARKALSQTHELGENRSRYVGGFGKDYVLNSDAAIVIEAEGVGDWDKETRKVWENIEGIVRLTHDNWAGDQIAITGTLEEQYETLIAMRDAYGTIENYDGDRYKQLDKEAKKRKELLDTFKKTDETAKESEKIVEAYNVPEDIEKQYDTLISKIVSLNAELASEDNAVRAYGLTQEISDVKQEINELAADYPRLKDEADSVFKSLDSNVINSIQSVDDFHEAWFKAFNDTEKNALKNVDTMKSALQSVMNGENISSDTFWQLAEFDTDHILNGVKMVGDEFQLTEEQIISLKDTYIKKQMESIQLRQTELKQLKSAEEMEARQLQVALDNWKFADKNLNNPKYRAEFEDLQNRLKTAKENAAAYGDEWNLNAILLRQYNASLGNTADLIQAAQSQAEKLSEAFVGRIDKVIDGINDQKDALTEEKEVLQDQLDILEAQADEIKGIIEDYEKVADIVKETIEEEISAIEETYNKQIEALKAQNEEREEAINLTEKLNNLNNAKNNKVVTYTEAGGFQYGVNKEAVNKAQQEYDKALIDSQIAKLEKERDSATAGFEEYAKLWENATKKATKAEEEELAARILGADWREKISEQDVEIFETYEQKYDEYGVSLNNITNIEIANVKKSIEAKDKEIKAKEDLLKEWQKYKTNVQNYVNDLKNTNKEYEDSIENITLTENSNLDERLANFKRFKGEYESMINRILELQDGVGDIEVNASVKMDDFTDGIKEVVDGIGTVSEKLAEAIKELGKMPSINSAGDVKYYQATGYQHYASGGVNSSTGLAWLDGTRSKPEVVLNNQDATKLYNLLHSMPVSAAQMFSSPLTRFAGLRSGSTNQSSAITITGNTINLPNVRDPQQFAREMERYLQTTLTESQITPPRS